MNQPDFPETEVPPKIRELADSIIPGFKFYIRDGFQLNPADKTVRAILMGVKRNNGDCPCHNNSEDKRCPCSDYRTKGECHCSLYLKNVSDL